MEIDKDNKAKTGQFFIVVVLFVLLISAAIEVVGNRQEARGLYAELRKAEQERDQLKIEWRRLRIEQSSLLNHSVIERQARESLNMKMPDVQDIKVLKE